MYLPVDIVSVGTLRDPRYPKYISISSSVTEAGAEFLWLLLWSTEDEVDGLRWLASLVVGALLDEDLSSSRPTR